MPMMNSEARKRAGSRSASSDPVRVAALLADEWDRKADQAEASGNGFAAVILHAHARELRSALAPPLSA